MRARASSVNSSVSEAVLTELEGPGRDQESRQLQPLTQSEPGVAGEAEHLPIRLSHRRTQMHQHHFSAFKLPNQDGIYFHFL